MKTLKTKNNGLIRTGLCSIKRVFVVSAIASLLAVAAQAQLSPVFTNVWVLTASNYVDMPANGGNNVRGIAISPITTNVLFASSAGGSNHVATVAFSNGSNYLGALRTR